MPYPEPSRVFALIVGVERYENLPDGDQLRGPRDDAIRFAKHLHEKGGVPYRNMALFLTPETEIDGPAERVPADAEWEENQPTHANILNAIHNASTTWPGDRLLFYWAGHGVTVEGDRRRLFTADATVNAKLNIDLRRAMLYLGSNFIPSENLKKQVFIVDACANFGRSVLPESGSAGNGMRPGVVQTVIGLQAGEVTTEDPERRYGIFTKALIDASGDDWPPALSEELRQRFHGDPFEKLAQDICDLGVKVWISSRHHTLDLSPLHDEGWQDPALEAWKDCDRTFATVKFKELHRPLRAYVLAGEAYDRPEDCANRLWNNRDGAKRGANIPVPRVELGERPSLLSRKDAWDDFATRALMGALPNAGVVSGSVEMLKEMLKEAQDTAFKFVVPVNPPLVPGFLRVPPELKITRYCLDHLESLCAEIDVKVTVFVILKGLEPWRRFDYERPKDVAPEEFDKKHQWLLPYCKKIEQLQIEVESGKRWAKPKRRDSAFEWGALLVGPVGVGDLRIWLERVFKEAGRKNEWLRMTDDRFDAWVRDCRRKGLPNRNNFRMEELEEPLMQYLNGFSQEISGAA